MRRRRLDLGLMQKEVAENLGVSASTVLGWEKWGRMPSIRCWPAMISFLAYDPYPEPRTTAERLKAVRRTTGWSQKRLAGALSVDPSAVRDWEGGSEPRFRRCRDAVEKLLMGFGL